MLILYHKLYVVNNVNNQVNKSENGKKYDFSYVKERDGLMITVNKG